MLQSSAADYDYQLSKARRWFGEEVLDLRLRSCHGQRSSCPVVTISTAAISRALLLLTSKAGQVAIGKSLLTNENDRIVNVYHLNFIR